MVSSHPSFNLYSFERQGFYSKEDLMDNLTNSLASMMALQEIARRCGFNRRKRIAPPKGPPQIETFRTYTGSQADCLDSRERLRMTTTIRAPLRIEVQPRRRWRWWGQQGWLVVLRLLHEQEGTWQCRRFFTNFQELCNQLGIDKDDPVWQCKRLVIPACAGTSSQTEDSGWTSLCMF